MTIEEKLEYNLYDVDDFNNSLKIDGFEEAFIGITENYQLIYEYEKMIDILMNNGYSYDAAVDYLDYNVINVHISGYNSPIIIHLLEEKEEE